MTFPLPSVCSGADMKVVSGFVNQPVSRLLTASWMVKFVYFASASKFGGKMNLAEGILSTLGSMPIGTGLHDPPTELEQLISPAARWRCDATAHAPGICVPFVRGLPAVAQKLIQLLLEVPLATVFDS